MKAEDITHGGSGAAYVHYGCRCEECTEANRARLMRRRLERVVATKDPNDPRHGKVSFYNNHGCRCEKCTAANSAACKEYAQKRKAAA